MIEYTVRVHSSGDRLWYLNGELHREDGPAVEYADGDKWWFLNGLLLTEEEHKRRTSKTKELKPCPFCESDFVNDTSPPAQQGESGAYFWVCPDCACCGPARQSIEEATEAWNTRPTEQSGGSELVEFKKFRQCVEDILALAEPEDSPYFADVRFSDLAETYDRIEKLIQLERDDIKISNFHRICKELGGSMADLDGDDYATDSRIKTTADSSTGI